MLEATSINILKIWGGYMLNVDDGRVQHFTIEVRNLMCFLWTSWPNFTVYITGCL